MKIIERLINSFDTRTAGFSARKLTAFSLMICVAYLHYKYVDITNAHEFLIADLCAILLLLGIITAQHVLELKNGYKNGEQDK